MDKMTSHERIKRMFEHRDADRIPVMDSPWSSTIKRWQREGMPDNVDFRDYFDLDKITHINVDITPRYEEKTIEETGDYKIYTSKWGVTMKQWKNANSTPEFLDFTITDPDKWMEAKKRMVLSDDRIPWDYLKKNYKRFREEGHWLEAVLFFGFDVTHSWVVGTETLLIALAEDPEWCIDMFGYCLDMNLKLFERIWDAGYTFDGIFWYDDMGYKHNQFFSLNMYREILKPFHQKAIDWAHSKGIKAHLHSCGDINPFVPELVGMGLDALNPLEVKAGMDPVAMKNKFGDKLVLKGGIDALLYNNLDAMEAEINRIVPIMKEKGGYIFSTDHSVPSNVSLEDFKRIIDLAKKVGVY